ncbi:MAG: transporter [Bacteroidota bacterium]
MKNIIRRILLSTLLCICLGLPSLHAQGPWAQRKGKGYSQLVFNTIPTYTTLFNGSQGSTRETERELSESVWSAYVEVGVTEKFTLGGTLPLVSVGSGEPSLDNVNPVYPADQLTSLGNVGIFGKYTLIDNKLKLALIAQVDFPSSTRNELSGLSTGVNAYSFVPKLSVGSSSGKWYYFGNVGYGYRNNDYHDFLHVVAEAGRRLKNEKFLVILNLHRIHNINNGNPSVDSPANIETGLYTSFQEYSAFLLKFFAEDIYKGLGGFVSVGGSFIGQSVSVPVSPALSIGVFYKW